MAAMHMFIIVGSIRFIPLSSECFVSREMAEREEQHKREAEDQRKKEEEEERKREQKRLRVCDTSLPHSHTHTLLIVVNEARLV